MKLIFGERKKKPTSEIKCAERQTNEEQKKKKRKPGEFHEPNDCWFLSRNPSTHTLHRT